MKPEFYLEHLKEFIDKFGRNEILIKQLCNAWADYWRYYVGVNVIPAFAIGKKPAVSWKEHQNGPIPESEHQQWKEDGRFISGMALIMGRVWHRADLIEQNYFLAGIDADNKLAIDELLTINNRPRTIEQLGGLTIVEQHEDTKDKLHFYVYTVGRQLKDKTTDIVGREIDPTKIPTFEVKASSKFLMYPSPNNNKANISRKILGTYDPIKLDNEVVIREMQEHINEICRKYGLTHGDNFENKIPIQDLFKNDFTVYEGHNRHLPLLRTMESLLSRVRDFLPSEQIIELSRKWNNDHCKPPLEEREFQKQWKCAINFIAEKRVESYVGETSEESGSGEGNDDKDDEDKPKKKKYIIATASDTILSQYHFATLIGPEDIYYYQDGTYVPHGDVIIKQAADALFGYKLSSGMRHEIEEYIKIKTFHKMDEFDSDLNIINMKNGLYDVESNILRPHSHTYLSMNQIPVIYDPKAKPKLFGKFLSEVLYPGEIKTLVELTAYTFHRDNPFEIIAIVHGDGSNGKSVFFGVLTNLHGKHNVSNISLQELTENTFALEGLVGKSCNLDAELSSGTIKNTTVLKKLTGNQPIRVEKKYHHAYDVRLYAKEWLSANSIPQTTDQTDAYFRRNFVIAFPNKFDVEEDLEKGIRKIDPYLLYKLTTPEELSGIFNVLMNVLRRILRNKKISTNEKTIQQRRDRYEMSADPTQGFLDTAIDEKSVESDRVTKEVAYAAYLEFCKEHNISGGSKESFGKAMKRRHKEDTSIKIEGKTYRVWLGLKLVDKYRNCNLVKEAFMKLHKDGLQNSFRV